MERNDDLDNMTELVDYYKDLYSMLSEQALRQFAEVKYQCKVVYAAETMGNWLPHEMEELYFMGDADLLRYLFDLLRKHLNEYKENIRTEIREIPYIAVIIELGKEIYSDTDCRQLFSPTTQCLDFFVCSQILRDIGEMTNARGCGIFAYNKQGKTYVELTLISRINKR